MPRSRTLLVTGATGLVGRGAIGRLLRADATLHVAALTRDPSRLLAIAATERWPAGRVIPVLGDVTRPGCGIAAAARVRLAGAVDAVLHCAADTTFTRALDVARATNTAGTEHVLELAAGCARDARFAFVSTAFVAGRRTGRVPEAALDGGAGWLNTYEQSKFEAEALVRAHAADWVILRSSTIACDDAGVVTQVNALHQALRVYQDGLAAMLPMAPASTIDVVTSDRVCDGVARLALAPEAARRTYHLCAGDAALPVDEMLDMTWARWARDEAWRRRAVARPAAADLATWGLFVGAVHETGSARLARIVDAIGCFMPQLALPKHFETTRADDALGGPARPVRDLWPAMLDDLDASRRRTAVREVA